MYRTEKGTEIYESLNDLVKKGIRRLWDYNNKYYVLINTDDEYYNTIWAVDKKTGKVSSMTYIDFMFDSGIEDKAKPIDPKILKRVS